MICISRNTSCWHRMLTTRLLAYSKSYHILTQIANNKTTHPFSVSLELHPADKMLTTRLGPKQDKTQSRTWDNLKIGLKGQFQGQQTRGERGKKTLPADAGSVQTNTLGLKIFSKFIWKISIFYFFSFCKLLQYTYSFISTSIVTQIIWFFLDRALCHCRP